MVEAREGRLDAVHEHGPTTRSLFFALDRPLRFTPGQFVSCLIPSDTGRLTRPYTIASDPENASCIELLVDRVPGGPGSSRLFALTPGDPLTFTGPWGHFTLERAPAVETVFVALGTGIAPVRPMLRRAAATAVRPLHLLYATVVPIYGKELAALPNVSITYTTPESVADVVRRRWVDRVPDRERRFYICGVGDRVLRLRDLLRQAGYERRAVQYERW